MNVIVNPGMYIVAVSGGVDSVVLLDILRRQTDLQLVIAHYDHGIRPDSATDAEFVATIAKNLHLPFVTERVELGPGASENSARDARYSFLRRVSSAYNNAPIITAHHQDDLIETAIMNLLRGTGRRGLTSLRSTEQLQRPLLGEPKKTLIEYAIQHKLSWREDTTNHDERYKRNYVRNRLLVRFDSDARQRMLALITDLSRQNDELDAALESLLQDGTTVDTIDRRWFCGLPHEVAKEALMTWLRARGFRDYDRSAIERLTVGLKVRPSGKRLGITVGYFLLLSKHEAKFFISDKGIKK
jgi:tRNA(Ile)-lysidine synthetase-like protein